MPGRSSRTVLRAVLAALTLLAAWPVAASPASLAARPSGNTADELPAGTSALPERAVAYRPATLAREPAPLLVLVHGYPGQADDFLKNFIGQADRRGLVLLAVQARDRRWDLVPEPERSRGPLRFKLRPTYRFAWDVPRIDRALVALFARTAIDPGRVAILGFSDGASYALSLGIANPYLFRSVIGLSPGFVVLPDSILPSQDIFVASGTRDIMLPYQVVARDIVPMLSAAGLRPHFRTFDGAHRVDPVVLDEALDRAFGPAP